MIITGLLKAPLNQDEQLKVEESKSFKTHHMLHRVH